MKTELKVIIFSQENLFENVVYTMAVILSWSQCVLCEMWMENWMYNFRKQFKDWYLQYYQWNHTLYEFTGPYWWYINIASGDGLVPSGNKPLPEALLTKISNMTELKWVKRSCKQQPTVEGKRHVIIVSCLPRWKLLALSYHTLTPTDLCEYHLRFLALKSY